jgi:outer membrane receptor protein involved in Fe transport
MVGVNWFYSKQSDIIQQTLMAGSFYERKYSNLGVVTFQGAELEGKWYLTKDLYLNGSLLYQDNHDSAYNVVPYANFGGKGGISYSHSRGVTLSVFDVYQGKLNNKFNGKLNNQGTGGVFQLLNFSSKFSIAKFFNMESKLEPSLLFKVDNIIGKEVWMYEYGGFSNEVIPTIRGREFFLGINLSL